MLDNMSRGRLDVGVGRGISPVELSFFNLDVGDSREMFREALDAMVSALSTGKLSVRVAISPSRMSSSRSSRFNVPIRLCGIRRIAATP
jgi:alkanesulfonate monooxygenase SsuD/methylene tetrahydromethanopterin reductase-like flavin-dependent oxidoreductase (luciferase family)